MGLILKTCQYCGKQFELQNCHDKRGRGKFCSRKCKGEWQSATFRGQNGSRWKDEPKTVVCEICGKDFETKPCLVKTKRFCSGTCMGVWQKTLRGPLAHKWEGGKTPINQTHRTRVEFKEWRNKVFERDNWTCQVTGEKRLEFNAHHILNLAEYPELMYDVDNGITITKEAHIDFHNKYGRRQNNAEQLVEYLSIQKTQIAHGQAAPPMAGRPGVPSPGSGKPSIPA